ncbi:phosphatase PAP2 family protein [Vibrio fluvialis]|nr:phosphatase PAP2 family protein [Vibrio fluvialis]
MRKWIYAPLILMSYASYSAHANSPYNAINESIDDSVVEAGDVLAIGIPAVGYFASWLHDDFEGATQLTLSALATQGIVEITKNTVGRYRPNSDLAGASYKSFPSGHSAGAFSGAAFLQTRYGSYWGIPAYAGATFVAASRVHGRRHYADDVLAGAGIAILVNQFIVSPYSSEGVSTSIYPNDEGGLSVDVSIPLGAFDYDQNRAKGNGQLKAANRHRFELNIGFNMTDSLGEAGARDVLPDSQLVDDHQPFSFINYQYLLDTRSILEVELSPNETRRYGTVAGTLDVGGISYQDGDELYLAFKQWSIGSSYYHQYLLNDRLVLAAGLGLYAYWVELESDYLTGGRYAQEEGVEILPSLTGKLGYRLAGNLSATGMARYQLMAGNYVTQLEAGFIYRFNSDWEMGLKYGYSKSKWSNTNIEYDTDSIILNIANRF